ncbi:amidohydrolase family protein [Lacimicrobium alkaliphilum]|uniref:Amidohydrolase n=1 Tax=Lacimicrobium alkaliphilum TaxID=1526571 RepID=A0ABQ1R573_9ALTE|nr:amidohydrolase family protein [Lacimicrobium alkaliphilum]GGD55315.1 amidohydrolase [Lacimicrobium alkaliphilum]
MKHLSIVLLTALGCASAQAENLAIVGGYVHTMSQQGSVEKGTVLISDGRIQSVSDQQNVPEGYRIINATDKIVTPGLIGAQTSLGLVEVGMSAGTVDASARSEDYSPYGAALDVSYAFNPDSTLIPVTRIEGFTVSASGMSGTHSLFGGQGAVFSLGNADNLVKRGAFITLAVNNDGADDNGGSRAVLWPKIEDVLAEVKSLQGRALTAEDEWHGRLSKEDANALLPVVTGDMPLFIDARRTADIRQVLALKKRHPQLRLALLYATEGWRVADEIAAAQIPVVLDPEVNLPGSFDQLGATMANAGRLDAAGVSVSIGMDTHNLRLATQHAGNAVANGLPWQQGLAALTINTARLLGIDQDYGSIEAGKVADVVIWSGDPLQVMEAPEKVFINGEEIRLESRQTKLRDRYLTLSEDKPQGYIRP